MTVADRDRSVFVHQKHGHRFADNIAAAHYNTVFSFHGDILMMKQFQHTGRRAGNKMIITNHDTADIGRMKRIHILAGINGFNNGLRIKSRRQRKLH
jgi:hypothetical protein